VIFNVEKGLNYRQTECEHHIQPAQDNPHLRIFTLPIDGHAADMALCLVEI
jgi:hypothetical protein